MAEGHETDGVRDRGITIGNITIGDITIGNNNMFGDLGIGNVNIRDGTGDIEVSIGDIIIGDITIGDWNEFGDVSIGNVNIGDFNGAGSDVSSGNATNGGLNAGGIDVPSAFTPSSVVADRNGIVVWRNKGKPIVGTISNVPQADSQITVQNSAHGLKNLRIIVNGQKFQVAGLKDHEIRMIDASSAMLPGNRNTITLTALGKPGTSAVVVISNGASG